MGMIDSERLDLPSASKAHLNRRCVGRQQLIDLLREQGKLITPEPTPEQVSGRKVHQGWDGKEVELTNDEAQTLEGLRRLEALMLAEWAGSDRSEPVVLVGREVRLWLHRGITPIYSGQWDVAYRQGKRLLILDGKTGWEPQTPAEDNDQLRELVALARFNYDEIEEFSVAILEPRIPERCRIAKYDAIEAELALRLLLLTLDDMREPDAPRLPGPYCKQCEAIGNCEEAKQFVGLNYDLAKRIEAGEFVLPIGHAGTRVLDSLGVATKMVEVLKSAYKEQLTREPGSVPGWRLRDGKKMREIPDVLGTWDRMGELMGLEQFLRCLKLSVPDLENAFGSCEPNASRSCWTA
jgi:hypothetical protein